jgi:hypothetical protein
MRENKIEGQRPLHGKDKLLEAQATKGKKGEKIEKEEIIVEDKKTSSTAPAKSNGAKP